MNNFKTGDVVKARGIKKELRVLIEGNDVHVFGTSEGGSMNPEDLTLVKPVDCDFRAGDRVRRKKDPLAGYTITGFVRSEANTETIYAVTYGGLLTNFLQDVRILEKIEQPDTEKPLKRLYKKGDQVEVIFDNSSHIVLEDQPPGYDAVMLDHFTLSGIKGECFVNSEYLKLIVPEHTEPAKAPEQPELKDGMFVEHKRFGIAKVKDLDGYLFLKIPGFKGIVAAQHETLKPSWKNQDALKEDYHAARKRVWEKSEASKAAREKSSTSFSEILRSEILKAYATGKSYFDSAAEELKKKDWASYGPGSLGDVNVNGLGQSKSDLRKERLKKQIDGRTERPNAKAPDIYTKAAEEMFKGADRLNAGKLQWSLVDFAALEPMVRVLMKGAKKYSPENWKKGLSYTSILDSTMRHMTAFKAGEDLDPETGEPHTAHMLCNLMFLAWEELNRKDLDNRKPDLSK